VPAPSVTLAIPCRDAGPFLRPLLVSLLAQSQKDCRLLLVDDGSRDDSVALARAVAGERLEIHRNPTPLGIGGNWNRCASLVTTPFFCLAHQDDVYAPGYVATLLEALERRPDAGIAHCRARAIDASGAPIASPAERFKDHFWRHTLGTDRAAHFVRLWRGNFVCCPTVLYRTDAVRATGPFRHDLRFALDWDYWFRLLGAGHGVVDVPEVLVQYRRHPAAATHTANADGSRFAEELAVLAAAHEQGLATGLLAPTERWSPAMRNNLLEETYRDLARGDRGAAAAKLRFVREHAPELWRDRYVRIVRALVPLGAPGRATLRLCRHLAVRFGLGGVAG